MLPTSDPGGRPGGITAARPTSARAASRASVGIDAASSGVRPPSASIGSSAQPSGTHTTYFIRRPLCPPWNTDVMPYAEGRLYYDADSHLMETSDWLLEYADPGIRDRIRPLYLGGAGKLADDAVRDADRRKAGEVGLADIEAGLMTRKGWSAYGAFDPDERRHALDLLGFEKQLVFSTFAPTQFLDDDHDLLYGGTRAHNRAMADFCSSDDRLIAVGFVPLQDADRAVNAVEEAL